MSLVNNHKVRSMKNSFPIGIDIDDTITASSESVEFFRVLSYLWPKVFIVTMRQDRSRAISDLQDLGMNYDEIIFVKNYPQKEAN